MDSIRANIHPDRRALLGGSAALVCVGLQGAAWAQAPSVTRPEVETTAGRIRGYSRGPLKIFKGVPFGAPTGGVHRFQPPRSPEPWSGVLETTALGPKAPQMTEMLLPELMAFQRQDEPESEDCLRLNIWTNGVLDDRKRPVMVWFHGGQFLSGSGGNPSFDGANLAANEDVVVVTVNHRLNVLGYLYLAELGGEGYAASGAAGVLDLVQALEWVRDNIANFGGDPACVTIFGESGGGGKVSALIAMPAAKGLFHRAIIQSGVRRRLVGPAGATRASQQVLGKLGLTPDRIGELQAIPYRRLIDAVAAIRPRVNFEPVVDGPVIATHPFDPSAPAASADVPLIIGSNSTETTFLADTPLDPIDAQTLLNRVRQFTRISEAEAGELIRAYKAEEPGASNLELYHAVSSDYWRRADAIKTAELKSARPRGAVYMYYFTWETPVRDGKLRSLHTLEIPFIFRNVDLVPSITGLGADRYLLSDKMSRAWAAFARTGDPSAQGLGEWPPYDLARRATMVFGASSGVANDPLPARRVAMARLLDRRESSDRPA